MDSWVEPIPIEGGLRQRARIQIVLMLIISVGMAGPFFFYSLYVGSLFGTVIDAVLAVTGPALLMLTRKRRNPALSAHLLGLVGVPGLILTTLFQTGPGLVVNVWLPIFIMLMIMMAGERAAMAWTALSALLLVAVVPLNELGIVNLGPSEVVVPTIGNLLGVTVLTTVAAVYWERTRQTSLAEIEASNEARRDAERRALLSERLATVGTLATGVAHELNTPLTYLMLNLEHLREHLSDEEEELAVEALGGARRMQEIIQQIKTFSRSQDQPAAPFPVHRPVDSAVLMMESVLRQAAELVVDVPDDLWVEAHEGRLAQVVVNLLQNAADAVPQGHGHITVRARSTETSIVLEVTDNGPGVPAELQRRIFDPFFTTKPMGKGTGLGLAICASIVQDMGGELTVGDALGGGAQFTLVLSRLQANATPAPAPTREAITVQALSLLLVDDDPTLGRALQRSLSRNHQVTVCTSAVEALERIDSGEPFDAIACDLMMPDLPGWRFHEALSAQHPELADRVLFISGGAFTTEGQRFVEVHRDHFLAKPFSIGELEQALMGIVEALAQV